MERITEKMLQAMVDQINEMKGFNNPKYSTIDSYVLDYVYGGVSLHRYTNEHGGISDVFRNGHMPKRELYNLIRAYITGLGD